MATVRYTVVEGELIAEKRGGVRKAYVPDPLGSTVALLDNTQTKTDTYAYWPYGEERSVTGSTPTPFRFVGTMGYYRDGTTRNYVRARHYQPNYGRWLTIDPIGLQAGDINLYRNVYNNPTNWEDPSGLCCWINVPGDCFGWCCSGESMCPRRKWPKLKLPRFRIPKIPIQLPRIPWPRRPSPGIPPVTFPQQPQPLLGVPPVTMPYPAIPQAPETQPQVPTGQPWWWGIVTYVCPEPFGALVSTCDPSLYSNILCITVIKKLEERYVNECLGLNVENCQSRDWCDQLFNAIQDIKAWCQQFQRPS